MNKPKLNIEEVENLEVEEELLDTLLECPDLAEIIDINVKEHQDEY